MATSQAQDLFRLGSPQGITAINRDAKGRLTDWVENGFTVTVSRDTAGRTVALSAAPFRGGAPAMRQTFIYNSDGLLLTTSGTKIDTQLAGELFSSTGQVPSLVPGAGKQMAFDVAGVVPICVFAQLPDGRYLCTSQVVGSFATQLFLLTGDPLGSYTTQVLANTSCAAGNALKDTLGNVIGGPSAGIFCAWVVSNGDIYFWARADATTRNHLFRCKAGTYTVGSDAGVSNKQACIDIGKWVSVGNAGTGGVVNDQNDKIRLTTQRSFLEAFINVAGVGVQSHLYVPEYNNATGRVDGVGGQAGNDQSIIYRSTDGGLTWPIFMEFSTGGTHQVDHIHSVIQDPYSKWIYILTGDDAGECNIIAYNGTAPRIPANASLATIAATPGYRVIGNTELSRYVDLCFTKDGIYGLPDCDSEAADPGSTGYVSTWMPKTLDYVSTVAPLERAVNIPPIIAMQAKGWAAMVSFRTHVSAVSPEPYLHIWTTDYEGGSWTLVAKIKNYRQATGVPRGCFIDQAGRVWISGTYGGGIQLTSVSQSGSAVCLNPVLRSQVASLPLVYNGA